MGSVQFQIVPCSSFYFFSRSIGPFQSLVNANCRVLICCTCHFQNGSSSLFILASSVCKSLQCIISALTEGGKGGHLFRFTCSVLLWGGRNTVNKYYWHVWGVLTEYGPYWICPQLMQCVLSRSTLLRLRVALQGELSKVGPVFFALPRSEQLRQPSGKYAVPGGLCILITPLVPATWFPRSTMRAPSQVCCVTPLGSRFLAVTLLADVNCEGSQEDLVSNWEPAHSLVEDAISGAKIGPCLLALAIARLPLCLQHGMGWSTAGLLSFGVCSILCSVSEPGSALG